MQISPDVYNASSTSYQLLAYVADLELEVDRLRKHGEFLRHQAARFVEAVQSKYDSKLSTDRHQVAATGLENACIEFSETLRDLAEPPGYHPVHDQVIAIAVRPLVEQVFRWQQRMHGVPNAILHLSLVIEYIEWFPARLRHIIDNLVSNALKYRDPAKGECRVSVELSRLADSIEVRVNDNGLGMPWDKRAAAFELLYRSGPARAAGLGVGLAVVKQLVEQSGGSLSVSSGAGQGTSCTVTLPRFDCGDYLD